MFLRTRRLLDNFVAMTRIHLYLEPFQGNGANLNDGLHVTTLLDNGGETRFNFLVSTANPTAYQELVRHLGADNVNWWNIIRHHQNGKCPGASWNGSPTIAQQMYSLSFMVAAGEETSVTIHD